MRKIVFMWVCILVSGPVNAGPWPRETGKVFLSYSVSTRIKSSGPSETYGSAYVEYGLPRELTIGASLGSNAIDNHKAIGFFRTGPAVFPNDQRVAVEIGGGTRDKHGVLYGGITTGQGTKIAGMSAWWTLDLRSYVPLKKRHWALESELTLGTKPSERVKTLIQVQSQTDQSTPVLVRVEGAVAYEWSPGIHLTASMNAGVFNSEGLRLGLGMWHEY